MCQPRGCGSCRRRSRSGTSSCLDAGTLWPRPRADSTKPCTAGRRLAPLPSSARSKRELLETRDARRPAGQVLRQPGQTPGGHNPRLRRRSPVTRWATCAISPIDAENPSAGRSPSVRDRCGSDVHLLRSLVRRTSAAQTTRRLKDRYGSCPSDAGAPGSQIASRTGPSGHRAHPAPPTPTAHGDGKHRGHDRHAGHNVAIFRDRHQWPSVVDFRPWLSLGLQSAKGDELGKRLSTVVDSRSGVICEFFATISPSRFEPAIPVRPSGRRR